MEKRELLNKLAGPLDKILGGAFEMAKAVGVFEPMRENIAQMIKDNMLAGFEKNNDLEVIGLENVPIEGGAIIVANHQSWLDAQVLGASSERDLHFIAKSDFVDRPVLSKIIELSESVYLGGDGEGDGLESVAEKLREGWLVAIFPEGTIPGEDEISRAELQPQTGLLQGRTGAVRLAIMAGVPIIPVGLSGTGQAFPPEAYPRLEMPPIQKNEPITIRYGKPIYFKENDIEKVSRATIRKYTDKVMKEISSLVDHSRCFVPIEVPIDEPDTSGLTYYPKRSGKSEWGALVLHGFTSHLHCVDPLEKYLKGRGIAYRFPILRGHGTVPHDMVGVGFEDWVEDAEAALEELSEHAQNIIVCGLSMGGLVSLELSMRRPEMIDQVVLIAPALKFADPLAPLSPMMAKMFKFWESPDAYHDETCRELNNRNYPFFATDSFASLYEASKDVEKRLEKFDRPLFMVQSEKDTVVAPKVGKIIMRKVSSKEKKIVWFKESGHEMLLDLEAYAVLETISDHIEQLTGLKMGDGAKEEKPAPMKKAVKKKSSKKKVAKKATKKKSAKKKAVKKTAKKKAVKKTAKKKTAKKKAAKKS